MGCLLCGKEIGPLRLLRDDEFCCNTHRSRYKERLGRALSSIAQPEPPPAQIAGFHTEVAPNAGDCTHRAALNAFGAQTHAVEFRTDFPLSIPTFGQTWKKVAPTAYRVEIPLSTDVTTPTLTARYPLLALSVVADDIDVRPAKKARSAKAARTATPPAVAAFSSLPPIAVESWIAVSQAAHASFRPAAVLPTLSLEIAAEQALELIPPVANGLAVAPPVPVEAWIATSKAAWTSTSVAPRLPHLAIEIASESSKKEVDPPASSEFAPLPACAVESWIATSEAAAWEASIAAVRTRFDVTVAPAAHIAGPAQSPQPSAVESFVLPAAAFELAWTAEPRNPRLELAVVGVSESVAEEPVEVVGVCEQFMPSPAAEAVANLVAWSEAAATLSTISVQPPALANLPAGGTFMPFSSRLARPLSPEPVVHFVHAIDSAQPIAPQPAMLRSTDPILDLALDAASYVEGLRPEPVESRPAAAQQVEIAASKIAPITSIGASRLPQATCTSGQRPAGYAPVPVESFVFPSSHTVPLSTSQTALPALTIAAAADQLTASLRGEFNTAKLPEPQAQPVESHRPTVEPIRKLALVQPQTAAQAPSLAIPRHGVIGLEFFSQRPTASMSRNLVWQTPKCEILAPAFAIGPVFDSKVEEATPQKKSPKKPGMAEVFKMPEARKKTSPAVHYAMKAIAASVLVGAILWFGAGAIRIGSHTPAMNRDVSLIESVPEHVIDPGAAPAGTPAATGTTVAAKTEPHGAMARIRKAISNRAASTVTDSFHNGMEAWGTAPKTWAAGWSRSPQGYVQPGQLAFFNPSRDFKDYRLEFFGQIDHKSLGWTVRSKDSNNYYAMKVKVVDPGLRPIVAMVHYAVVGGKKSKPIETPLNVMTHNNTPFQVAVDVKGNRMVTSIDGQEVDTWIDDTLPQGGVGFFADAGEKARLYWMKVSKNEDFLGRVCAFLSSKLGDGSNASAELWAPELPDAPQRPGTGMPRGNEAVLAAAMMKFGGRRRTRSL